MIETCPIVEGSAIQVIVFHNSCQFEKQSSKILNTGPVLKYSNHLDTEHKKVWYQVKSRPRL